MLHKLEIEILQQANEILQRNKLGGRILQPQHLSTQIQEFIFDNPNYIDFIDKSTLEVLCDFYAANPSYLEDDIQEPPTVQFCFVERDQSIHYAPAMNMKELIGDSIEPFIYETWTYPVNVTFVNDILGCEIVGSNNEMPSVKFIFDKMSIENDLWPILKDEISRDWVSRIHGHDELVDDIEKIMRNWLEKHPNVLTLIRNYHG